MNEVKLKCSVLKPVLVITNSGPRIQQDYAEDMGYYRDTIYNARENKDDFGWWLMFQTEQLIINNSSWAQCVFAMPNK